MSDTKTIHITFRLDPETLARVDALIPVLSTEWRKAKRSDVLRAITMEALPVLEARSSEPKKGGRR